MELSRRGSHYQVWGGRLLKTLSSLLAYHVTPGRVTAAEAAVLMSARTVHGQPLTLAEENGKVMADHARVLQADIPCANGIIHVIDHVISPKD